MGEHAKILVIGDDPALRKSLRVNLQDQGYRCLEAASGEAGLHTFRTRDPDLILVDLDLPHLDGLAFIRHVRRGSLVPIVVVTIRCEEGRKVEALDLGADDYVVKPFGMGELIARLRTALRHRFVSPPTGEAYRSGDLTVDFSRRQVLIKGAAVHLSPTEYRMLAYLAQYPGKMITNRQLIESALGESHSSDLRHLRVVISHIRRKLEPDPGAPRYLLTDHGVGYKVPG